MVFYYLFIIKIVHEVQEEKLKYTKETKQYTALGYTRLSLCDRNFFLARAVNSSTMVIRRFPKTVVHDIS